MAVRVRVGERVLETVALANSGYESETPQILGLLRLHGC